MTRSRTTERERAALRVDPWGDGKSDDRYVVFKNKIVVTRKLSRCVLCFGVIQPGSRVRAQTEQSNDHGVKTFKFCPACVEAMAAYNLEDNFELLEQRYVLGRSTSEGERSRQR